MVTVIQARRGSSRLPDKVMLPLAGKPLLARMVERVRAVPLTGSVVVATTTLSEDDAIADLCRREGFSCFRGHPTDLLDRHYQAGLRGRADAVVKIPSDCPLIDPKVINRVLTFYVRRPGEFDYVSNLHPATYPDGNDVEVMSWPALTAAWQEAKRNYEREHTTPFIWDHPERFRIGNVIWERGLDYSMTHRWTIDYEEDYRFIKAIYDELHHKNPLFGVDEILALLKEREDIAAINSKFLGVNWYRHHLGDLRTVGPEQTRVTDG
jgi:spore coat polysaccharide biosynthesis protein SpsF